VTASTVAVTVLWIAVLTQFPAQRKAPKAPIRTAVWLTMLLLAAIGTLDLTAIGARLDTASGLPNAADLTQHVLAIVAATLARYSAVAILGRARQRDRWSAARATASAGFTVVCLVGLFASSPARTRPVDTALYTDFPMQFASHAQVLAYWAIFAAYLGTTFVIIARLGWRYGRTAGRSPLGRGLRLLAAGMVAGLGYLGYGTAVVAARAAGVAGGSFIRTAPDVIQALFGALVVLVAAGGALPATQNWPVVRQAALYRSLRLLYPLWAGLCQAVPGIALDPVPLWADRLDPRDLRMRLYRRVIEIRDGYMALAPVDVPGIEDTVRAAGPNRLSAADQVTLTAATRLELARRAELRGDTPPRSSDRHAYREFVAGTDLDSEVRLLRVVVAHWPTICLAAETIERGSAAGAAPGDRPARLSLEPNRPLKTGTRSLTTHPHAGRGCAAGSAARAAAGPTQS